MYNKLVRLDEFLAPAFLLCMTTIILFQVLNRYIFTYSLDWPEELGRYLFLFAVYQGTSYAEAKNRHLEITILRTLFKGSFDIPLQIISKIGSAIFAAILTWWGVQMVMFVYSSNQLAPSLQIPMYFIYICVPLGMASMVVHSIVNLFRLFRCPQPKSIDLS